VTVALMLVTMNVAALLATAATVEQAAVAVFVLVPVTAVFARQEKQFIIAPLKVIWVLNSPVDGVV